MNSSLFGIMTWTSQSKSWIIDRHGFFRRGGAHKLNTCMFLGLICQISLFVNKHVLDKVRAETSADVSVYLKLRYMHQFHIHHATMCLIIACVSLIKTCWIKFDFALNKSTIQPKQRYMWSIKATIDPFFHLKRLLVEPIKDPVSRPKGGPHTSMWGQTHPLNFSPTLKP